jgi:CBS domain-containing protein
VNNSRTQDSPALSLGAAGAALFFLMVGVGVVWFTRTVAEVEDGAVLTALVVVPALLYILLRGGLAELRGPGGWGATFVRVARTTVSVSGEKLDVDTDVQIIEKESLAGLTNRVGSVESDQPVLMTMTLGRGYTPVDVQGYLETLAQFPRFRLVAFLDNSGAFLGCTSPAELRGIMRTNPLGSAFLNAVASGNVGEVFRYPGMLRKVLPNSATNADALSTMVTNNLNSMAVVDENRRLHGVIERDHLVSKLVVSLTSASDVATST